MNRVVGIRSVLFIVGRKGPPLMDIIRPGRGVLGALSIATRVARRQRLVCRGVAVRVRRDTHAALGVQAGDLGGGRQLSDISPRWSGD